MDEGFDPYFKWLGIPAQEQPPDHYRLLGIPQFVEDRDVIANAADQRMAYVRQFAAGPRSARSQALLNELAAAKVCLLDPKARALYDEPLRRRTASPASRHRLYLAATAIALLLLCGVLLATTLLSRNGPAPDGEERDPQPLVAELSEQDSTPSVGAAKVPVSDVGRQETVPARAASSEVTAKLSPEAADADLGQPSRPDQVVPETDRPVPDSVPTQPSADPSLERPVEPATSPAEPSVEPPAEPAVEPPAVPPVASPGKLPAETDPPPDASDPSAAGSEASDPPSSGGSADSPELSHRPRAKHPIPSNEAQHASEQTIRRLYADPLKAASSLDDKAILAEKLLEQGRETTDDPVTRYVLLQVASNIAAQGGDIDIGLEAVDRLSTEYEVDEDTMTTAVLADVVKHVQGSLLTIGVTQKILEMVDEAVASDRYEMAQRLADIAVRAGRKSKHGALNRRAAILSKEIQAIIDAHEPYRAALIDLRLDSDDPAANFVVGHFLCLMKGDWDEGLTLLAKGGDGKLSTLAAHDLRGSTVPGEQSQLAAAWWRLGSNEKGLVKKQLIARSVYWYKQALSGLTGRAKADAERRIAAATKNSVSQRIARTPRGAVLRLSFEKDTFARRDKKMYVRDLSGKDNHGTVFAVEHGEGPHGSALALKTNHAFVDLGNSPSLQIEGSLTIALWLNPYRLGERRILLAKAFGGEGAISLEESGVLNYYFGMTGSDSEPYARFGSNSAIAESEWTHVAVVRDIEKKQVIWYLNGVEDSRKSFDYEAAKASKRRLYLGRGMGRPFLGLIDEVMIWNRVISPPKIAALAARLEESP